MNSSNTDAHKNPPLSVPKQPVTDLQRNLGHSPITHDPVMVTSENLDLEPQARSSWHLRLHCAPNLRRTLIAFRRKCFPWTLPSSVVATMTFCAAMCFAMLIGIVVVCLTIAKQPGMCRTYLFEAHGRKRLHVKRSKKSIKMSNVSLFFFTFLHPTNSFATRFSEEVR